jgi:hypothetical protein
MYKSFQVREEARFRLKFESPARAISFGRTGNTAYKQIMNDGQSIRYVERNLKTSSIFLFEIFKNDVFPLLKIAQPMIAQRLESGSSDA